MSDHLSNRAASPGQGIEISSTEGDVAGEFLEEETLPRQAKATHRRLPVGTVLSDGSRRFKVVKAGGRSSTRCHYLASEYANDHLSEESLLLIEAKLEDEEDPLALEAEILSRVNHAMFPGLRSAFRRRNRSYLVIERLEGNTLEDALANGSISPTEFVRALVQVAQALRKLHQSGFAHLGLTPANVILGQPVRIFGFEHATRLGGVPKRPFNIPGYSAPELMFGQPVTGREDVYSLAAILYRAVSGRALPEEGTHPSALPATITLAGIPQLIYGGVADPGDRLDLESFYRALVQLKRKLEDPQLEFSVAAASNVGLNPTRHLNEDAYAYWCTSIASEEHSEFVGMFAVADGMGGMEAGERASQVAVKTALSAFQRRLSEGPMLAMTPDEQADLTSGLVREANAAVCAALEGVSKAGGTTLTVSTILGRRLAVSYVGDTRAYLIREGSIQRLTEDHSLVTSLLKSGMITEDEAWQHPDSNKLTRSLGNQRQPADWFVDDLTKVTGQRSLDLAPGDILLLCSDGLWGQLRDEEILEVISEQSSGSAATAELIRRVLARGAPDNVTVMLVRAQEVPLGDLELPVLWSP